MALSKNNGAVRLGWGSYGPVAPTGSSSESIVAAAEETLGRFFASRASIVESIGGAFPEVVEALRQYVLQGGKRVRPAFAWLGFRGAGGPASGPAADAAFGVASALELLHACALIHDDIIDASLTRRGVATVHVDYAGRHRRAGFSGDSARYGESIAILLGDLALSWSEDMVTESGVEADAGVRLESVWSAMRTEVIAGQLLDIEAEVRGDETVEAALRVSRYKTAAYTIERPLQLGAALAGADDDLIAAYGRFGHDLGIAFQLRDDLLGVFGDPALTGKPSGDDIREGKRTVLLAVALAKADVEDPAAAQVIRESLGTEVSAERLDDIRAILTRLGAVAEVERRIDELMKSALAALDGSTVTDEAKLALEAMAISATRRSA
ncbi:MAG: polyprenyl synthetase family protein [Nocardiaceae bacterium]|nr:polyprenyl synthetase family protein [Nocardiaceae bacterium]